MRSKEVEEAIKTIQEQKENVEYGINAMECTPEDYDEDIYNDYIELKKKADTVLNYISNLEQENINWKGKYHLLSRKIDVTPNSVIRNKIKDISNTNFNGRFLEYDKEDGNEIKKYILNKISEILE